MKIGDIKMLKVNTVTINTLASNIAKNIQQELYYLDNSIKLPIGAFFGTKLLSGIGPNIHIKLLPSGNVITEFKSEFKSAGINQTIHRLYLNVTCNIKIVTPYDSVDETIINQVLMCESVIVGNIPGTFYEFNNTNDKQALEIVE